MELVHLDAIIQCMVLGVQKIVERNVCIVTTETIAQNVFLDIMGDTVQEIVLKTVSIVPHIPIVKSASPEFFGNRCDNNCRPQCLTCDSGDSCTPCRDGWSGSLCQCSKHCENEDCDDHGICLSGCNGSYYGGRCVLPCPSNDCQRCDQTSGYCTDCSKGLYGINCTEKCSWSCLGRSCNMTGACLKGCKDGFNGPLCTITHSSTLTEREKDVNIRKLQIENLRLDNEKLQKEIHKLELETDVCKSKRNIIKLNCKQFKKNTLELLLKWRKRMNLGIFISL